jgi:serine/threonine-protein kinase HipA
MTSERTRECFVHVVLPGETAFVPAARFQLTVDRMGSAVGRLVYGRSYLAHRSAVPIDPVELPLAAGTFETRGLDGLFGALRDAGPDHWGRRVIERHSDRRPLDPLDYLLLAPDDRAGALGFGLNAEPPPPRRLFNRTLELEHLQRLANAFVAEEQLPDEPVVGQVEELLLIGTAMGGARPKVVVEDEDALWIAKFNRPDDAWNAARVEHAMLLLARECGLHAATSRVVSVAGRDVLLVKRFDREHTPTGYRRARMLSALTLLRAGDTHLDRGRWSYVLLAEALRRVVARAAQDAPELFRRMVFNALISNTDDHPRNHAVIAMDADWALSPAYDLTPATPVSLERRDLAMDCGDDGRRAQAANLLSQSARFLLTGEQARATVDEMEQRVRSSWYEVARRAGVSERDCARIAPAFAYPGFGLR